MFRTLLVSLFCRVTLNPAAKEVNAPVDMEGVKTVLELRSKYATPQ